MSSSVSGIEMKGREEDGFAFEIGVVISKGDSNEEKNDCIDVLINELKRVGLLVQRAPGLTNEFVKIAATTETLGKAAAELHMKKPTHIGMDLQFEWDEVEAFLRQPDGTLFSWCERFQCYIHLIYGIVNDGKSDVSLKFDGQVIRWEPGESLLRRMEAEHIVELVFPLHDEIKRKKLQRSWALNLKELTDQPIDEVYSYFGTKVAVYFAFLGMYTRWLIFPAVFGLILQLIDFRSLQLQVLPIFFISIILWAVLFFQFWKRKNSAVLARWQIYCSESTVQDYKLLGMEQSSSQCPPEFSRNMAIDKRKEAFQRHKEAFQRHEWLSYLMRFRNDSIIILSIVCLQLPFELAYAHLYTVIKPDIMKFGVTAVYLFAIQNFTTIGGKVAARLIKSENNENTECRADSLVYKVFGVYFMQSYIGVFYHALLHRNFRTLRQLLLQRLIISEVFDNLLETCLPYLKYKYKKFSAVRNKKKNEKKREEGSTAKFQFTSRVEKEYMKPTYSASIGEGLEDGLFDDFLELALQFGMVMMFACAFPLGFVFLTLNNLTEIRADALKLLVMFKRPIPRAAATIGAWQNIFQFLIVMSICTNSALLVWLYDQEGNWKIEPGLAGILIMEHVLLIIKFALSHFVPEEPAWVRARRMRNASQAQLMCSKRILRSIFDGEVHDTSYVMTRKRLNKKWQSDRSWMPRS